MFNKRTLFIVGAGASKEVGLPIGNELTGNIADLLNWKLDNQRTLTSGDQQVAWAFDIMASDLRIQQHSWVKLGPKIAGSMPLAPSIDNYLHTHSDNAPLVALGKLGITRAILAAERASDIWCEPHLSIDFRGVELKCKRQNRPLSWHNVLFKMLIEGVEKDGIDKIFSNISIVTFNYDRCIEHYFAHALARYLDMPIEEAYGHLENLEIIHPYGKVGELTPRPGEQSTPFGAELDGPGLARVSQNIRTFTERETVTEIIPRIKGLARACDTVVSLGFSFLELNLDMFDFSTGHPLYRNIVGSAYGISESNREAIRGRLVNTFELPTANGTDFVRLADVGCARLLEDHSRLIVG